MGSYLEAGKGLPSQETLRSHEESFRWPQDNSGKSGGSAELAPPPPGGQAREEGRRKGLPVWLGTPTGLADTHTPASSWSRALRTGPCMFSCARNGFLPGPVGSGSGWLSAVEADVAAQAVGTHPREGLPIGVFILEVTDSRRLKQ